MPRTERFIKVFVWFWATAIAIGLFTGWSKMVVVQHPAPVPWWKWVLLIAVPLGIGVWNHVKDRRNRDNRKGQDQASE